MIGKKFKNFRIRKGLSRKKLADILDCSLSHVCNVENNISNLSDKKRSLLFNKFPDLDIDYFDNEEDPKFVSGVHDQMIGRNIRKYRRKFSITQEDLAKQLGYSGAAPICAIEKGHRPMSKKMLIKCSEVFKVHVAELLSSNAKQYSLTDEKLIDDFYFLVQNTQKPSVYPAIVQLIKDGIRELRDLELKNA